jgi:hypothetical protein
MPSSGRAALGARPILPLMLAVVKAAEKLAMLTTFEINETDEGQEAYDALDAALAAWRGEVKS